MKKLYVSSDLPPRQEDDGQTRRLYKYIVDAIRRLDEARGRASTISDLFTPTLLCQRLRFRDYCEKLIFTNPITHGHKCEDLLWRKAYYDVVSTAKRLKSQSRCDNHYSPDDTAHLNAHLNSGIGHYYHIISRLQIEFDLNLHGIVDFPIVLTEEKPKNVSINEKLVEWAKNSVHRCLIYLGDLSRYRLEFNPNQDPNLAIRYYVQASYFNPKLGIPHNQLGTLATNHNYSLDAAYHYIRCLSCAQPFEGAEGNLIRLFEKNVNMLDEILVEKESVAPEPISHIKRLISRFLLLVYTWYFDKNIADLNTLCQQTLIDIQTCINYPKPVSSEPEESQADDDNGSETPVLSPSETNNSDLVTTPQYISADIVFKMVVICLLSISKSQRESSEKSSSIVAFTLAIFSILVKNVIEHIQDSVLNLSITTPEPEKVKKKTKKSILKLHRRRRKRITSSEESDVSDTEIPYISSTSDDDDASEVPEDIDTTSSDSDQSDDEFETKSKTKQIEIEIADMNGDKSEEHTEEQIIKESLKKVRKLDPNDVLELIADEGILQSIKILSDWLRGDVKVVKACGKSSPILIQRIVQLINLINVDTKNRQLVNVKVDPSTLDTNQHTIALPEDLVLKNVPILKFVQENINWEALKNNIYEPKEEALIRLYKLVAFGNFLKGISETGVSYEETERQFCMSEIITERNGDLNKTENDDGNQREGAEEIRPTQQELMKNMGQLWLAAEVRDLEYKTRGRTALSPYLVVDIDALTTHTHLVKQLVAARKFIVVVPSIVVSALDELKRETGRARDAIRWLEAQFQRGNRFLRAQRNHERASIPLIKYPKKKDKQSFTYIQIIECCYFLAKQQKGSSDLVTLLTGKSPINNSTTAIINGVQENSNGIKEAISYTGLAKTAGIHLELITTFHNKWKKSLKGQR